MFINERPKKRRKSRKRGSKPEEDGFEWEEVMLDTPGVLEMEAEWEKLVKEADEEEAAGNGYKRRNRR